MPESTEPGDRSRTPRHHAVDVVASLREAIIAGQYLPNQRLIESELCEQFDAKRGTIRMALVQLEGEGIIERIPDYGSRVRKIPVQEAVEISELRMVIEGLCARRAAERITEADVTELLELRAALVDAVEQDDFGLYSRLNRQLHIRIVGLADQPTARTVLIRLNGQNVRHQFQLAFMAGRARISLAEHLAVLDAIVAREPDMAEQAMRVHMASVMEALRTIDAQTRNTAALLA